MIKFEFESKEAFEGFVEDVLQYQEACERTGLKRTLAETFLWVYECTGEE